MSGQARAESRAAGYTAGGLIRVQVDGNFGDWSRAEFLRAERAVTRGVHGATVEIKAKWRAQVAQTLGARLGNAVRADTFPKGQPSAKAAGIVYTRAPQIVGAHQRGDLIRAKGSSWLAVPLPAAGRRGYRGGSITPDVWERRTGRRLKFIRRKGRAALLVDDGTLIRGPLSKFARTGKAARGVRNRTVPIFALVPQVKLRKVLTLYETAATVGRSLPGRITDAWSAR